MSFPFIYAQWLARFIIVEPKQKNASNLGQRHIPIDRDPGHAGRGGLRVGGRRKYAIGSPIDNMCGEVDGTYLREIYLSMSSSWVCISIRPIDILIITTMNTRIAILFTVFVMFSMFYSTETAGIRSRKNKHRKVRV